MMRPALQGGIVAARRHAGRRHDLPRVCGNDKSAARAARPRGIRPVGCDRHAQLKTLVRVGEMMT